MVAVVFVILKLNFVFVFVFSFHIYYYFTVVVIYAVAIFDPMTYISTKIFFVILYSLNITEHFILVRYSRAYLQ
jgi:hypothetical protein